MRNAQKSAPTLLLFFLTALLYSTHAARILGFFPSQSKSNLLIHCAIADTLQQGGHEVHVIATMPNVYPHANYHYTQLNVSSRFEPAYLLKTARDAYPLYWMQIPLMWHVTAMGSEILNNEMLLKVLAAYESDQIDLFILGHFLNDFHLGVAAKFRCPIIVSSTHGPIYETNAMVGNPAEYGYVPSLLTGLAQPMTYWERVQNVLISWYEGMLVALVTKYRMEYFYSQHFPSSLYPSYEQIRQNISLVFANHHSLSQGPIRPNVPNIIEIGGIHINDSPQPLPRDITDFLSTARKGAIYVSFGSNIECFILSPSIQKSMFQAFHSLPYKVLWKWGNCPLPGKSENILYKSWFPQNDILAHPNVKLFITHGGSGSIMEAEYFGVPMLGMPFFGDQPGNVRSMLAKGMGLAVDYRQLNEENFREALEELMLNERYAEKAQEVSRIYRDRPMTTRQTVNYWVDYVLRYQGAWHLQSPAIKMSIWQLYSVDVWALLGGVILGLVIVGRWGIRMARGKCCRSASKKQKATKKKRN